MKIAIIGTGISGMTAAWLLHRDHEITVFEAEPRIGGHTHTVDVVLGGKTYAVDTGFIVYNRDTYPNFIRILEAFGVETQPSNMSFSVRCERSGLEYSSSNLFAQRQRLLDPKHYGLIADILRFNQAGHAFIETGDTQTTLGDFVARHRLGEAFRDRYLIPMLAAIWSADPARVLDFPAQHFLKFFKNHGLMQVLGRPTWRVIQGGSRCYAEKLTAPWRDRLRLACPVESVTRLSGEVLVKARGVEAELFDHVIFATHSNTTLSMLQHPTDAEREILGAIAYQSNEVVLHTDTSLLPREGRAWASWNYRIPEEPEATAKLTYNMNRLQGLDAPETFCVTLNDTPAINPQKILRTFVYDHPVFNAKALAAQRRHAEISGQRNTHFCGAYWGYGFHEDGVNSGLRVAAYFGKGLEHAELPVSRASAAPALHG
ncbi:MAG: FAD-dependent oxidoreductase [Candidatus Hydrogenedens sp.]|nr:FAD-dependent oxidoreductase [Candidatus Hydrogenedens sp.]